MSNWTTCNDKDGDYGSYKVTPNMDGKFIWHWCDKHDVCRGSGVRDAAEDAKTDAEHFAASY